MLHAIGPVAIYGLRSVELVRAPITGPSPALVFGHYQAPGRIVLYEQPRPPWRLQGLLAAETVRRLERAGAVVTPLTEAGATCVTWPGATLQRFMLQDVLLHEVGHHVLQQHKGKRLVRVARTRDHEAFAARFTDKQRAARRQR